MLLGPLYFCRGLQVRILYWQLVEFLWSGINFITVNSTLPWWSPLLCPLSSFEVFTHSLVNSCPCVPLSYFLISFSSFLLRCLVFSPLLVILPLNLATLFFMAFSHLMQRQMKYIHNKTWKQSCLLHYCAILCSHKHVDANSILYFQACTLK